MFKHKHEGTNDKNPQRFNLLKHWWDFHLTDGLNVSYGKPDPEPILVMYVGDSLRRFEANFNGKLSSTSPKFLLNKKIILEFYLRI